MALPTNYKTTQKAVKGEQGDVQGAILNGFILNNEYRQDLKGKKGVMKFREMMSSDATVKASHLIVTLPIRSLKWFIQPASEDKQDQDIAEFVDDVLFQGKMDQSWSELLAEMLLYLPLGRYAQEIVYDFERSDGMIGITRLAARPPETLWQWNIHNTANPHVTQITRNGIFQIPWEKLVVLVNEKEGYNFEGVSILRSAFPHWYLKNKMYLVDAMAAERQGLGIPSAKIPAGATPSQKTEMVKLLEEMRAMEKGYITYPANWVVGFMDMMSKTTRDIIPMVNHHDSQIMFNVLAQFLKLGSPTGSPGSYALSSDHSNFFMMAEQANLAYLKGQLQQQLIKRLVDVNFVTDKYPTIETNKLNRVDIAQLGQAVSQFVTAGTLTATPDVEESIRNALELEDKPDLEYVDPSLADEMIKELGGEMNDLHQTMGSKISTNVKPNSTEPNQPDPLDPSEPENAQEAEQAGWTNEDWYEAAIDFGLMKADDALPPADGNPNPVSGDPKDVPRVEDKLKPDILQRFRSHIPYKKHKEYTKIASDAQAFTTTARTDLLTRRAKGEKVTAEQGAGIQLGLYKQKSAISKRIVGLKNDMHMIKNKPMPKKAIKKEPSSDNDENVANDKKGLKKTLAQKDKVDVIIEKLEHELSKTTTK